MAVANYSYDENIMMKSRLSINLLSLSGLQQDKLTVKQLAIKQRSLTNSIIVKTRSRLSTITELYQSR